jgi:uncharacterized protein (DUF362 family)
MNNRTPEHTHPPHEAPPDFPADPRVSRREFLWRAGSTALITAGSVAGGLTLWQQNHFVPGFQKKSGTGLPNFAIEPHSILPTMGIAHGLDREKTIRAAIDLLGGIDRFIKNGDIVMIKPNVAFDRPPALGATTHPDSLRALAKILMEAGAAKIIIADNPINSPTGCFLKSGLTKVASDLNLDLMYPEASNFAPLEMDGEVLKHWTFFQQPFKRATKVIGLTPCKDHNLCHASMTMKNWYGLLGGRRNQFHQHIHSIVSDFALMMKPTFVILDGTDVLMKNGPTGGRLSDVKQVGTVVAGTDMVAVDSYGYVNLLGRNIDELTYIHKAHARKLGNMNWRETAWKETTAA